MLADVLADLGCSGEVSSDALLSWLGELQLPELAPRARLSLHNLLFWTQVLAAPDPGLTPAGPMGLSRSCRSNAQ